LALLLAVPVTARADALGSHTAHARFDAAGLKRRLGPQAVVDVSPQTGTPRVLARLDGSLSGPAAGSPAAIAAAYVRSHLSDLGLTSGDVDALEPPSTTTADGVTQVRWGQSYRGIPAADSDLRVTVARDGRVTAVLGSPAHDLSVGSIVPGIDAGAALRAVQADVGVFRSLPTSKGPAGATRTTAFRGGSSASLQIAAGDTLTWRVTYDAAPDAIYDATVDAKTGKVLRRVNMVKSATNATVWDRWAGGATHTVDIGPWLTSTTKLDGPFVHAFADVNDNDTAQASEEVVPGSYTFQSFGGTGCATLPCAWSGSGATWQTNESEDAVQAFYYANTFRLHLADPPISFTLGDKLDLNTDDGASTGPDADHRNNANMYTPPPGSTPRMQMYLFQTSGTQNRLRNVDGGDDAAILYHEYTHGLSNRLVVDGTGAGALNGAESGAMGEAWSDWYAMDYLVQQNIVSDTGADGELDMGAGTDLDAHVLRTEPIDCSVGSVAPACVNGGYTYADFGGVIGYPEVHADGEIWAQTLWDIRKALGSTATEALVTDAMRFFSPPEPSFLDERNAILQADQTRNGGANRTALWTIFANRGMGYHAVANDGADVSPIASFDLPPDPNGPKGTISGTVTSADTGLPLANATVGVAGLESGSDKLVATSGADGRYTIANAPVGTYPRLLATSNGYWPATDTVTVATGAVATRNFSIRRNWASTGQATSLQSDYSDIGCGPDKLIDQQLGTGWSMDNPGGASQPAVIDLQNTVDIDTYGMDPNGTCGDTVSSMTTRATVDTTTDPSCTTGWVQSADVTFGSDQAGKLNTIHPAGGTATGVRCVRLTLLSGGNAFRDFSELAVFSKPAPVATPTPTPTATPVVSPTPTPIPTATPTPAPPTGPTFTLPKSGKRGAAAFSLRCAAACTITATLTADAKTKRKLRLATLGTKSVSATRAGTTKVTIALSAAAKRALKKHRLKSVTVTLKVVARYPDGRLFSRSGKVKIAT
jgi:Zn-dependent metalloprotease